MIVVGKMNKIVVVTDFASKREEVWYINIIQDGRNFEVRLL